MSAPSAPGVPSAWPARIRAGLIDAVDLIATHGHRLLPDYRFDAHTGQWHHRDGTDDPPLRLTDVR
ncbi:hypothetical protein AB0D38_31125, partial [Streptomyces sp. NPDC048279]|uniref:hypothetical protein n=1 Tax=Streptomyces sp. NPDC048279 TaxID=3154714 RepID=UPI00342151D6